LPAPPFARDWSDKLPADVGMMRNDIYGDCVFAAQGHAVQIWTSENGNTVNPSDADVLAAYAGCTGFKPGDPSTDNGSSLLAGLRYWRTFGLGGHKIGAYLKLDHHNIDHVKIGINLFGGVYVGADMPIAAQHQATWIGPRGVMHGNDTPGGWGGHCMWVPKFDRTGPGYITWGKRKPSDWQWWLDYVDEAYVAVAADWVNGTKPAPSGFNLTKLQQYLASL
jgi:hypothetical protein